MVQSRKLICLALAVVMLACVLPLGTIEVGANTSGDWEYSVADGSATITKYTGAGENVIIPSSLGGYPVTAIGENAFYDNSTLKSVVFPDSVTSIGEWAFGACRGLKSVTFGNGVRTIGDRAFRMSGLSSVTFGSNVTTIGESAFSNCRSLTSVVFSDSVTTIGKQAFYACSGLQGTSGMQGTLEIGRGVQSIGYQAFAFCSYANLKYLKIPNSVTSIDELAFGWCTGLKDIYCEAPSKPSGWNEKWSKNTGTAVVHWGREIPASASADVCSGHCGDLHAGRNVRALSLRNLRNELCGCRRNGTAYRHQDSRAGTRQDRLGDRANADLYRVGLAATEVPYL